jgi:hypothetical protein
VRWWDSVTRGRGSSGCLGGVKLHQDPLAAWRWAMDLGLTAKSRLANHHGWISWMILRLPPTFLLRPVAWGPVGVLE